MRSSKLGVILFVAMGLLVTIASLLDYFNPASRRGLAEIVAIYKTVPMPNGSEQIPNSLRTFHKTHSADLIVTYWSTISSSEVNSFYRHFFVSRGWRVCVPKDQKTDESTQGVVFEKSNYSGDISFSMTTRGLYFFGLSWTDYPESRCTAS